ncbi:hypothetical protein C8R43DRAFT_636411 [Mycena crocata]|nr:hypothetical protein C8R43DRAFT_636411 [Mycena crocata]
MLHTAAESEQSELMNSLLDAEAKLERLEALLSDIPDPYGERAAQCEDLAAQIQSLRIAIAPHTKLPPELLAEIFLFCSAAPVSLPPTPYEPLLVITQVSRTWRELALQVPELWASITVSFTREDTDIQRITSIAEEWIARSGPAYPLSITAECNGAYAVTACENPEPVSAFIPMVITHAHRLQHIDLAFPIAALLPLFGLPAGAFSFLETLALRPLLLLGDMATPETGHAGWHWPSTAVTFDSAPLVREVTYSPVPLFKLAELEEMAEDVMERAMAGTDVGTHPFFAPSFPLPWSQLSIISFPFTALTVDIWRSILSQCLQVTHVEVAIKPSPAEVSHPSHDPHIHLDCLTYLSISAFSGGGNQLVEALVAPQMTTLVLMGVQFPTTTLLAFQLRSNFVLETFIPVIQIPAEDVERLFEHLSDVKTLIILAVSTDHFPASFWDRVGRCELLPQLQALLIRPTAEQASVLVDMIAARWGALLATDNASDIAVGFCDVKPAHLDRVNDELRRLEEYAEGGRAVELMTIC